MRLHLRRWRLKADGDGSIRAASVADDRDRNDSGGVDHCIGDDMTRGSFNIDGTLSRKRNRPCSQCGAMEVCDICWEHYEDWSPFGIIPCQVCEMPNFVYHPSGAGCGGFKCLFCGFVERPL